MFTQLVTVEAAAKQLGISRSLLYRMMQTKQIASIKLASRRLLSTHDLEQLIEKARVEPWSHEQS